MPSARLLAAMRLHVGGPNREIAVGVLGSVGHSRVVTPAEDRGCSLLRAR